MRELGLVLRNNTAQLVGVSLLQIRSRLFDELFVFGDLSFEGGTSLGGLIQEHLLQLLSLILGLGDDLTSRSLERRLRRRFEFRTLRFSIRQRLGEFILFALKLRFEGANLRFEVRRVAGILQRRHMILVQFINLRGVILLQLVQSGFIRRLGARQRISELVDLLLQPGDESRFGESIGEFFFSLCGVLLLGIREFRLECVNFCLRFRQLGSVLRFHLFLRLL